MDLTCWLIQCGHPEGSEGSEGSRLMQPCRLCTEGWTVC